MKALVVGGTGFLGMNVLRALVADGHEVVATRRTRSNTLFARKLGARLQVAELDDVGSLVSAMRGQDVVFMCAGHYPRYSLDLLAEVSVARARIRRCVAAAIEAGVPRMVLTSSTATIGPAPSNRPLADERDRWSKPPSVYHAVKIAIEEEAAAAVRGSRLELVTLCASGVLGALDVKAGTGFLVVALGNGGLPFYVDGRINVVDAETVARAHVSAATRGRAGERYIIGAHNVTVCELLRVVAKEIGIPMHAARLPGLLAGWFATIAEMRCASAADGQRPFLSRELVDVVRNGVFVDSERARRELLLPAPPSLLAIVRMSCDWYARHRYIPPTRATAPISR